MIVHILHQGFTLCGFGRGQFPGEWPGDHKWTYLNDLENVTCEKCLDATCPWCGGAWDCGCETFWAECPTCGVNQAWVVKRGEKSVECVGECKGQCDVDQIRPKK